MKSWIFVLDKFDGVSLKKIYVSNPDDVQIMIGEKIDYKGYEVEVTDLVVYREGYMGNVTKGVKCVILKSIKN
jgi:hypothetical protein